jgi:hypothetical protein
MHTLGARRKKSMFRRAETLVRSTSTFRSRQPTVTHGLDGTKLNLVLLWTTETL